MLIELRHQKGRWYFTKCRDTLSVNEIKHEVFQANYNASRWVILDNLERKAIVYESDAIKYF